MFSNSRNPPGRTGLYLVLCVGCGAVLEVVKGGNAGLFQAGRLCLQNTLGACKMDLAWKYYGLYRWF